MYKAIIFDLDNTLINYTQCELESMKRTCNDHSLFNQDAAQWELFWQTYLVHNERYWIDFVTGGSIKTINDVLKFSFRDTLNLEEILHSKLSDTYWNYFCNTCFFENGAEQLLEHTREKYQLGIITNGISSSQRTRLRAGNIDSLFQSIVISDEVGIRKPKKEIFEMALNELNVSHKEALFVGDSLQDDYQGSINSGIDFCYYNRQNVKLSADVKPKYVVNDLLDLVRVMGL